MRHPANFLNVQQGTAEWLHARCGNVTASRVADVIGKLKSGKYSQERENYMLELLTEVTTGRTCEHFVSVPMQHGIENEPLARTCYELKFGVEVERVGFVLHPTLPRCGGSPDGLVGEDGMLEIKCPTTLTHWRYLFAEVVPEAYKPQMLWNMACAGRKWTDFISYDPRLPSEYGLFIVRFMRDDKAIAEMEAEVEKFIGELAALCQRLPDFDKCLAAHPFQAPEVVQGPPRANIPTSI